MTADSTMFLERIHKQFECSICTNTLKNPSQLQCGHVFCAGCLTELQKTQPTKNITPCPLCKDNCKRRSIKSRDDITKLFYEFEKLKFAFEKDRGQSKSTKPIKTSSNSKTIHDLDNVIPKTKVQKFSELFDFDDSPQTSTTPPPTVNKDETKEKSKQQEISTTTVEGANINKEQKKKKTNQDDYDEQLNEPISDVVPSLKQIGKVQTDKNDEREKDEIDEDDNKLFNENPSGSQSSPTFEFCTASGKAVTVSQAALDQAKNMFRIEFENDDDDSTIIKNSNKVTIPSSPILPEKSTTTTTTSTDLHNIDLQNDDDESLSELPGTPPSPASSLSKIHRKDNLILENISVENTRKSKKEEELSTLSNNNNESVIHPTVRRSQILESGSKKLGNSQNIIKNNKKTLSVHSKDNDESSSSSDNVPLDLSIKLSNSQKKERENKRPKLAFRHLSPSLALDLSCKRLRSDEEEDESTSTEYGSKSYYGNSSNLGNQISCPSYSRRNSNKKMKSTVCKSLDDEFLKYGNEKGISIRRNQTSIIDKNNMDERVENLCVEKEMLFGSNQHSIPKVKEVNSFDDAMTCRGDQFLGNLDMNAMINLQTTSPIGMKKRERSTGDMLSSSPSKMGTFKKLRTNEKEIDDIPEENKKQDDTTTKVTTSKSTDNNNIMESPRRRPPIAVTKVPGTPNQENDYDSEDSDDSFLASTPTREAKLLNKSSKVLHGDGIKSTGTTTTTTTVTNNKLQKMPIPISPLRQKTVPGSILKTPGNTTSTATTTNMKNKHYMKTPPSSTLNRPGCFSPPSAYQVETTDLFEGINEDELDEWSDFENKSMEDNLDGGGEKENGLAALELEIISTKTKKDPTTTTSESTGNNTIINLQTPKQWTSPTKKPRSLQQHQQTGMMIVNGNRGITENIDSPTTLIASQLMSRKFVFCFTRLSKTQEATLREFCNLCNGTVTRDYTDDVSHLVLTLENQRVPQTMKYLRAIAGKKWIIVFDWVEECLAQKRIVSEEKYETSNFTFCDPGVRMSRLAKVLLFEGFTFYVLGKLTSSGATSDLWRSLLKKLGARVVTHPDDVNKDVLIVGDTVDKKEGYQEWYEKHEVITVAWEWILDCTLAYKLIPLARRHTITKVDLQKKFSRSTHPNFPSGIYPTF